MSNFYLRCGVVIYLITISGDCASLLNCKLSSPNFSECKAKELNNLLHDSKGGLPEFGITAPFDPLDIPKLTIDSGKGPVQLVEYYKNLKVTGLSDVKIKNAHFDASNKILSFIGKFPLIVFKGYYSISGKLLALPITGQGPTTLDFKDVTIGFSIKLEEQEKKGQIYMKINSWDIDILPSGLRVNYENLFNGNKLLGDNMNKLINEEWEAIFMDVKPSIDKEIGEVFKRYWQPLFEHAPADVLFPK